MPVIRRTIDPYTLMVNEHMYQRPPKEWVDAGQLEGNPHQHAFGWKGYLVDGRGNKVQISAQWTPNEYMENNLEVTLHDVIGQSQFIMYKTGKVTFRGPMQFFNPEELEIPYRDEFTFSWCGNEPKFWNRRNRAFRIRRRVART